MAHRRALRPAAVATALLVLAAPTHAAAWGPAPSESAAEDAPADETSADEAPADASADGAPTSDGEGEAAADEAPADGGTTTAGDATPAEPAAPTEPEAPTDDDTTARAAAAFKAGSDAYELGRFAEAAARFGEAWELSHKAPLLYNLGQAHWRWFDTDPDIEHLRQARLFFTNYDKRMRLTEGYDAAEIQANLAEIERQIAEQEKKIAEANRPVVIQSAALTDEEVQREHRRKTTKALNISGTVLIVVGASSLGAALGSMAGRAIYGALLDNTTGGDGGPNLSSAEDDRRRRDGYLVSGQVAFATLIVTAATLPAGIVLRSIGARRMKTDGQPRGRGKKRANARPRVRLGSSAGSISVRF